MGIECNYSFWDLFNAAFSRLPDHEEMTEFNKLSQDEKNEKVLIWANKASWATDLRTGNDGKSYIAFHP